MSDVEITVKVTPAQIKDAIKAHFNLPPGPATCVEFILVERSEGYGTMEHTVNVFEGAKATFKKPLKDLL